MTKNPTMTPTPIPHPLSLRRLGAISLLACSPLLAGCDDDGTRLQTLDLAVQVEFPAAYAQSEAPGARVILRSAERGDADTLTTNAQGQAVFPAVLPGTYEISANRPLQASEALQLTGIAQSVELNALEGSVQVTASSAGQPVVLRLAGSPVGSWVIKEMYYTGSARPSGGNYFFDQFFEIVNNSTDTLYAGGLMLATIHGVSGQINPGSQPTPFQEDRDHVYAEAVWGIPGGPGDHPVAPGGSILIAQQGINHRTDPDGNPGSPVDLGDADWEMYVDVPDSQDLDSPSVPNMQMLHRRFGFYALVPVFGPAMVLVEGDFESFEAVGLPGAAPTAPPVIRIPVAQVLDGVEALQNAQSAPFKRLPPGVDAGFVFASGTYTGESVRRRVARVIGDRVVYQDTNNSAADFEVLATPTPREP
jgi:hypothetical protein